jgi:hypothetical protein
MKIKTRVYWLYDFGSNWAGVWFVSGLYQTKHGVTACVDRRYYWTTTLGMDGVE